MKTPSIESRLDNLSGILVLKDVSSKFLYMNRYTRKVLGWKNEDSFLYKTDFDIPSQMCEHGEAFQLEDKLSIESGELTTFTFYRLGNEVRSYMIKKTPEYQDGQINGIWLQGFKIDSSFLFSAILEIVVKDHKKFSLPPCGSYVIGGNINHNLSTRQLEVLYYLLRGFSIKEIARILCLSPRTIEVHVNNLKLKFKAVNKNHLIEIALLQGFLFTLPTSFFMQENIREN